MLKRFWCKALTPADGTDFSGVVIYFDFFSFLAFGKVQFQREKSNLGVPDIIGFLLESL